ncbi:MULTISPECIES: NAD(P)-dependent oxidoreductase [Streptomyces]|uniref:Dehydrogenase n=2 Tax=Streptomyces TaxID=1883 RepID=A0A2N8PDY7_STRNR|nr:MULTISPECIES: NAD(P)-binding domain-containing protein [Streptomyces]PNE39236.1 dehydrogenase [Streptomyces noursei]SHM38652.1 3-hydroxyisobutyrate dehydrogenase [Streptomyces yunnanensis]
MRQAPANTARPAPVSVLGLGAMGGQLARALLAAGHPTTVWNRTPAKADALVAQGARRARTVADAVAASPLAIVCVLNGEVVHRILEPVGAALSGKALVNLTSDTPERNRRAAAWAAEHGIAYLGGAMLMPPTLVGRPEATILYSGSRRAHAEHEATLKALAGRAPYLGPDAGTATAYDVALLSLYYAGLAGMVNAFALAGGEGIPAQDLAPHLDVILGQFPSVAVSMARDIDAGRYSGEADVLAIHTAGLAHIIETSRSHGINTDVLRAVKGLVDRAIAAGYGDAEFAGVIEEMRA